MKVIRYSKAFELQAVRDVETGEICARAVERKYGIKGTGTVTRWVRQLGNGKFGKIIRVEKADEINEAARVRRCGGSCSWPKKRWPMPTWSCLWKRPF